MVFNHKLSKVLVLVTVFLVKFCLSKDLFHQEKSYIGDSLVRKPRGYGSYHHDPPREHYTQEHPVQPIKVYWHQSQMHTWGYHAEPSGPHVPYPFYDLPSESQDFHFPEKEAVPEDEHYNKPTSRPPVNNFFDAAHRIPTNINAFIQDFHKTNLNDDNILKFKQTINKYFENSDELTKHIIATQSSDERLQTTTITTPNLNTNDNNDKSDVSSDRGRDDSNSEPVDGGMQTLTGAIGWRAADPNATAWVFKCGSTLISYKFVLTAAHCTYIPADYTIAESEPKIVRLGDKNIIYGNARFDVDILQSIVHPMYKSPKKYYDIALMELSREVLRFTNVIRPACLWNDFNTNSLENTTVTGWGAVSKASFSISPELQVVNIDVIDSASCDRLLRRYCNRNFCGVQDHQVCGGVLAGGIDSCQGDSGGPFQAELPLPGGTGGHMHHVFGVTSFGVGCAEPNTPAVYTRVSAFVDWIESIVW